MGEFLPELHREEKTRRCLFYPIRHVNRIRRTVKRTVHLDRIEETAVILQFVPGARRVEIAVPGAFPGGI